MKNEMNWNPAWKTLPDKDGIYLCQIDEFYAILQFNDGHFQPNDWGDFVGVNGRGVYHGVEECVVFWQELSKLNELTNEDINERKKLAKQRRKKEMEMSRAEKNDKRYAQASAEIA